MRLPELAGVIERRLLVSYAVDPAIVEELLPAGLRPHLVQGKAVAGVCLIRMGALRPAFLKLPVGWRGENAAQRIAVEYEDASGTLRTGVYVPERFSSSYLPVLAGGRFFPGRQRKATFSVAEGPGLIAVGFQADGEESTAVSVAVEPAQTFTSALFPNLESVSAFYRESAVAWSPGLEATAPAEGLELSTDAWAVRPAHVIDLQNSWLDGFSAAEVTFDHALIMQQVPVQWRQA
jgi:hypothetical protein